MPIATASVSGAQVDGDAEQLGRVVRNLLDNATRYAESGVVVTLAESDGTAVLTIADDGPGSPRTTPSASSSGSRATTRTGAGTPAAPGSASPSAARS